MYQILARIFLMIISLIKTLGKVFIKVNIKKIAFRSTESYFLVCKLRVYSSQLFISLDLNHRNYLNSSSYKHLEFYLVHPNMHEALQRW
ncbi:hypothetical protein AB671_01703 [Chryseobacterium sp. BGARF1]|nr:hypothetical protein AB671_01703 [Chryseobacterium sp. BGARF1]